MASLQRLLAHSSLARPSFPTPATWISPLLSVANCPQPVATPCLPQCRAPLFGSSSTITRRDVPSCTAACGRTWTPIPVPQVAVQTLGGGGYRWNDQRRTSSSRLNASLPVLIFGAVLGGATSQTDVDEELDAQTVQEIVIQAKEQIENDASVPSDSALQCDIRFYGGALHITGQVLEDVIRHLANTFRSPITIVGHQSAHTWSSETLDLRVGNLLVRLSARPTAQFGGGGFQAIFGQQEDTAQNERRQTEWHVSIHKDSQRFTPREVSLALKLYESSVKQHAKDLLQLNELGVIVSKPKNRSWDEIAGYETTKNDILNTVVLPFAHGDVVSKVTAATRVKPAPNQPKAVLFEGPPGTGKTTAARILASTIGLPFVYIPLEAISSPFYGQMEKNLKQVFDTCHQLAPVVVFIDEVDTLARARGHFTEHEASRRVMSVLLKEIDGFIENTDTMVIGATNRKEDLDPAFLSRCSASIAFPLPTRTERSAIFERYAKHLTEDNRRALASVAKRFSGRDIVGACELAERRWTSKLIGEHNGSSFENIQITAPPFEEYLSAVRQRVDTVLARGPIES